MERYLAVAPEALLQWLQHERDQIPLTDDDAKPGAALREVLRRAREWCSAYPWELRKAKSRRAMRNVVRPLCFAYRRVQVVEGIVCSECQDFRRKRSLQESGSLEHQLKLLRLEEPLRAHSLNDTADDRTWEIRCGGNKDALIEILHEHGSSRFMQ